MPSSKLWNDLYSEMLEINGPESGPEVAKIIMELFVVDFDKSVLKRLDVRFWNSLKKIIDALSGQSKDIIIYENVVNLALGYLVDLSVLVHKHYDIPDLGLPKHMTCSSIGKVGNPRSVSMTKAKIFCAFIMLRLGDVMRYKGCNFISRQFYETSVQLNQADGAGWNQLGVVSFKGARWLESVYCHTRALYSTIPFHSASANISSIFKKFANRDVSKDMPIAELAVAVIAKFHFLMEIEGNKEHIFEILGNFMSKSKEFIICMMSVYDNLEEGTELENRILNDICKIWSRAFQLLVSKEEIDDENILLIVLLLRIPNFCKAETINFIDSLSMGPDDKIVDKPRFDHFKCRSKYMMKYPITRYRLIQFLSKEDTSSCDFDSEESESSLRESLSESEADVDEVCSSPTIESCDEEILIRGVRRGRVLDDSDDESDDNFI